MVEKLKKDLADNYHDDSNSVLMNLVNYYSTIASNISHREVDDERIEPYIYTAVKEAYLRRGDEGSISSNEGGLSSTYVDIEEKLRKDCMSVRKGAF